MISVSRKQQKAKHQAKYRTLDLEEQQINRKQEKEARLFICYELLCNPRYIFVRTLVALYR